MKVAGIEDARQQEYVRAAERRIHDTAFECGDKLDAVSPLVWTAVLVELRNMYVAGFARGIEVADNAAAEEAALADDSAIEEETGPVPFTRFPKGLASHLDPFSGE